MADQLGVATLLIGVNTRAAEAALKAFVGKAESILSSANTNAFSGLAKGADTAGKAAGEKLAKGIKNAVTGLKFDNIEEALNFSGALNGTIADLKTYKAALLALRDATKTTTPGFKELNGEIESVSAAIKSLSTSTDDLNDLLNRTDASRFADDMKLWAAALRENDRALRDTDRAIRDADRSLRNYDKASNDAVSASQRQAAAARELRDAYLGVAGAAVKAAAGAVGTAVNVGKGAVGAVGKAAKTAVSVGKTGYDIGAGLGIFDEPGTGPFGQQIKAVSERFKFVAEQAKTTRGVLLRVFEGLGAGAGLMELVKNADLLKSILNNLGGTAKVAEQGLNGLAGTTNIVAKAFNSLEGDWTGLKAPADSLIGNLVNVADGAAQATAGAGSLADTFAQFGVELGGTALDALVGLNSLLGQVPIEAAGVSAAVAAALAVFGGDLQKQAASGIGELINKITNLGNKALQVRGDLQTFYQGLVTQPQLALPSTEQLQPERNGIQRLDPQTNSLINATTEALALRKAEQGARDEAVRLGDALDTNRNIGNSLPNAVQRGNRFLEASLRLEEARVVAAENLKRVLESIKNPDIPFVPAYLDQQKQKQLKPAVNGEFVPLPNPNASRRPIGPNPITGMQSLGLGDYNLPMDPVSKSIRRNAEKVAKQSEAASKREAKLKENAARAKQRQLDIDSMIERALKNVEKYTKDEAIKAERLSKTRRDDRNRRTKDAISSGLIGGAFPALFGQGIGASVGGGLGGVAGGLLGGQFGFGLSLIGTSIGTAFDTAIQKSKDLAKGLEDPIENFGALQEAAALSSRSVEAQAEALISVGRTAEAAALIQGDLAEAYGNFDDAKQLAAAQDDLNRSWTKLSVTLAGKVAPTLTNLTERFSRFAGLNPVGPKREERASLKQFSDYLNDLEKRAGYKAKLDVSGRRFNTGVTLADAGGDIGRAEEMAYKKAIEYGQQEYPEAAQQKAVVKAEQDRATALQRQVKLRSLSYQLITAEAQGNKRAALQAELDTVELERQNKLKALGTIKPANRVKADEIETKARQDSLKIAYQLAALDRAEALTKFQRATQLRALNEQIRNEQLRGNLSGTGNAALQATQFFRDAVRAKQNADKASALSPNDAGLLEASRQAGDALKLAAEQTRTNLIEAFRTARREAQDAAASLQDAYINLLQLRTGNNGLNNYLSAQERVNREQETFKALLPQFELAKQQARNILGNQNFDVNFTGTTQAVNQKMIDFIRTTQLEKQAGTGLNRAQEEFVKAQNSLQVATEQLTNFLPSVQQSAIEVVAGLQALVEKQWNVGVTVNRDTGAVAVSNAYAR